MAIAGANGGVFTILSVQASNVGDYTVVVTNAIGSVTSAVASLALTPVVVLAPTILSRPAAQTVPIGGSVTFLVSANGTPSPTYQWYRRGSGAIAGATSASLTLATVTNGDAGDYYVVATNSAGSATSSDAHLIVSAVNTIIAPSIVQQPTAQNVLLGGTVTITVIANGTPTPTYQWYFNGGAISGATNASFYRTNAAAADAGSYYVRVTNSAGATESVALLLSVLAPEDKLSITTQPASRTAAIGSTVAFTVSVQGPAALSYQWFKAGQPLAGETQSSLTLVNVQTAQASDYSVTVSTRLTAVQQLVTSNNATLVITPATSGATAPTIIAPPASQTVTVGSHVSFSVTAGGSGSLSYQWLRNGGSIAGATASTHTIPATQLTDAANYSVSVTNMVGSATSAVATLNVNVPSYAGTYFGQFGGNPDDRFAFVIRSDGTAVFYGYASSPSTGYIATNFKINADGTFTADLTDAKAAADIPTRAALSSSTGLAQAALAPLTLSGSVASGALAGTIPGTTLTLAAAKSPATGPAQAFAGIYQTAALNRSMGGLTTIVDASGQVFMFSQTATGITAGTGTLNPSTSKLAVTLADSSQATATLNPAAGSATASVTTATKETISFAGLADGVARTDRLVNLASRGAVSASDLMIAGFVITGTSPKSVMIRATGPALTAFGLGGTLANPKLELYRGSEKIQENDDWSLATNAADIPSAAARTGAFPLVAGSRDAVLFTSLAPGGYTAQVSSVGGTTGVALVEVYDAGEAENTPAPPRLVNISTRAAVAGGESLLIAGIVITGNAPKQILIRATGPALTAFGLPGALADPLLKLFRGDVLLKQNDNWSDSVTDAALITTAGKGTGAFALTSGSKDAALLLTLEPGSYTAQVSGVGLGTGVALVEVYEVNR